MHVNDLFGSNKKVQESSLGSNRPTKPVMRKVVESFGSRYAEKLAQAVYDENPNLDTSGHHLALTGAGFTAASAELGAKKARNLFAYDEDFADDFIGAYQYLQQGGAAHVREGWKEKAAAAALAGTMATGANSIVVNPARIIGPQGQTVADPYKSGASKKSTPVDDEWAKIEKRKAADKKVNESDGASVEDIEGAIYRRINALHPTLNKKFSQNEIDEAVYNVACFHEGATELGSSDISIMVRQVLRSLENAQGEETFEGVANDALKSMGLDFGPGNEEEDQKSFQQAFGRKAPHSPWSEGYRAGLTNYKDLPNQHNPYTRGTAEHEEFDAGFEEGVRDSRDHWSESVEEGTGLSYKTLSNYKKKAGEQAGAADKAGDYKKGHKRFKGIVRATNKEFDKDARKDVKESSEIKVDYSANEVHAFAREIMQELAEEFAEHQAQSSSVPSAPDTSKFRAQKSGMIEYVGSIEIPGQYHTAKYHDFMKIGSNVFPEIKRKLHAEFADELASSLGLPSLPKNFETNDGYIAIFSTVEGSNWGGFGIMFSKKMMREEQSAECDTDQLLEYLTSAWRRVVNMHENDHFTTNGFQEIRLVYELLRDPLLKGDFSGFERAWEYVSGKFVDAFDFFAEIAFEEAGLDHSAGTYEQFIDKCRSGSIDEGDHPVPKLDPRVAQKLAQKVADKKWAAHQADDKKKQQQPFKSGERTLEEISSSLAQRYMKEDMSRPKTPVSTKANQKKPASYYKK